MATWVYRYMISALYSLPSIFDLPVIFWGLVIGGYNGSRKGFDLLVHSESRIIYRYLHADRN